MELWGGVECTINRIGDTYNEQLDRLGHPTRLSDFDGFAALGITAIRLPVLWERTAPYSLDTAEWSWSDDCLQKVGNLGLRPIIGLVHHGSGPRNTNLLDPDFPKMLSAYARCVAARYPEVLDYTPVNEPLTTARFSALYGHWYPHHRNDLSFAKTLITQCRAVILAMKAILSVNPKARLIQTEDLGTVYSTPRMTYQAEFENERRWCSFDLLCGRMNRNHPMWNYLTWVGVPEDEMLWFLDNPCPPSIIGINHYLSSDRFLDENISRYPDDTHGGNERDRYADVLAARVCETNPAPVESLITQAWERYHLPIAITECHNGCSREEQLRWFLDVWRQSEAAFTKGVDVRAVTAWSLLGAFDWNCLVTQAKGFYETGVFDVRSPSPRPTAMARLVRSLASSNNFHHPVLNVPGWWNRPDRLIYGIAVNESGNARPASTDPSGNFAAVRPVLITGGTGTLGRAFARICERRGIPYRALSRSALDVADPRQVRRTLFKYQPWAVINAAGYVRVDDAETDFERCYRENTEGALLLAKECAAFGLQLVTFSSDLVFDGDKSSPYVESDLVSPLNCYGASKATAETVVGQNYPDVLIIRTSAFFGPWDEYNFVTRALRTLKTGALLEAADDVVISPTYVPHLVNVCLDLLIDGEHGIWHLANQGEISWADLAEEAARLIGISGRNLRRRRMRDLGLPAKRPTYSVLGSEHGALLLPLSDALKSYVADLECKIDTMALAG